MASSFFTGSTVVEVLADTALVSDTLDWSNSTSITFYLVVDHWPTRVDLIIFSCVLLSNVFAVHHHLKDAFALLAHLLLDESLELFSWESTDFFVLLLLLLDLFLLLAMLLLALLAFFIVRRVGFGIRAAHHVCIFSCSERFRLLLNFLVTIHDVADGSLHE